jgi:dipeptidyl aminopeptidase/acylaminoacyl peptidase
MTVRETATEAPPTIERLLSMRELSEATISPDGSKVAFPVGRAFTRRGETPASAIWEARVLGGELRQLTRGAGSDQTPRWSPDGWTLAFASDRDTPGVHGLYVLGSCAEEARPVGPVHGSVEDIQWAHDGERVAVLVADPGSDRAGTQTATKIGHADESEQDPEVTRPHEAWRHLWIVELETGRTVRASPDGLNVWEFHWDGESRAAAIVSDDPSESAWYDARLALLDFDDRSAKTLYAPQWQLQCPRLSPAGREVACIEGVCSDRGIVVGTATVVDARSGEATPLMPELDVSWLHWRDDERLWYSGWQDMGTSVGLLGRDGSVDALWAGDATVGGRSHPPVSLSADATGTALATVLEAPDRPPEVVMFDIRRPHEGPRALTRLNAGLKSLALPEIERVAWQAPDGLEIEGLLLRPADRGDEPLPLVVIAHGGPTSAWTYHFTNWGRASSFAAAGYAVLLPNPRGSSGRGQAFARANVGDLGGRDLDDLLAGVDELTEAGVVDGDRVGITGASYGGYLSAWAITQTDRFAAAIPVSCISNGLSFRFTTNIGEFVDRFVGGAARDGDDARMPRSPVTHARAVTTPTLIVHGELDLCTPVGQARELYHALVEAGAETELVVYPREGHAFLEYDHQVDMFDRMVRWFDVYLGGGERKREIDLDSRAT